MSSEASNNLSEIIARLSSPVLGQATMADSAPIVIASDQSAIPVSGTFFQTTQPVSGTFFQATQPISGSVSVSNFPASQAVTGSFFQATQPISASALPLPSGASTSALQSTGNTSVGNIDTKTPALGQAVMASSSPVVIASNQSAVPISAASLPLPSGASTETTLSALNTKIPSNLTVTSTRLLTDGSGVTQPVSGAFWQATQPVSGPLTDAQLRASAVPISGTFWQATQPISGTVTANQGGTWTVQPGNTANTTAWLVTGTNGTFPGPTLSKGIQAATGYSVQSLKDAGRTHINLYAVAAASGATGVETAITLTKSSGTSATTTGTSFVVTSGKTFRISAISVATRGHATATIQATTFNLRMNTAGAVIASSTPVLFAVRSATPATASAWDRVIIPIPEGFEIAGNGTIQIGITANAIFVTNAPTWDVSIIGFEY